MASDARVTVREFFGDPYGMLVGGATRGFNTYPCPEFGAPCYGPVAKVREAAAMSALGNQIIVNKAANTLQKLPTFAGLQPAEHQAILTVCEVVRCRRGEVVFEEQTSSLAMYIVLSGEIEIRTEKQGRIVTMQPGELFGEIGMIGQAKRTASAVVTSDATLLKISKDRFDLLLGRHPAVTAKILRNIASVLAERLMKVSHSQVLL